MIAGVDHLALSCRDVTTGAAHVQRLGFNVKFIETGWANSLTKRPFLIRYEPVHAVAYAQGVRGIALELTEHGVPLTHAPSFYQPLFTGALDVVDGGYEALPCDASVWEAALGCGQARAGWWKPFGAQLWCEPSGPSGTPCTIRAVLVPVKDLEASAQFWTEGFGGRAIARGEAKGRPWLHLAIAAPLPRWSLEVVLVQAPLRTPAPLLDHPGFPCLALISTNAAEDRARLLGSRAQAASELSGHTLRGRRMTITIIRGPSDELVELIEFVRDPVPQSAPESAAGRVG